MEIKDAVRDLMAHGAPVLAQYFINQIANC